MFTMLYFTVENPRLVPYVTPAAGKFHKDEVDLLLFVYIISNKLGYLQCTRTEQLSITQLAAFFPICRCGLF
jgi:hypothetical protein